MHLATSKNHAGVIKVLLAAKVDPKTPKTREYERRCGNAPRTAGDTAIMYAFRFGHIEAALEFLPYLESDDLNRAVHWAAEADKFHIVLKVVELGKVDINKVTNGRTLLYLAAYNNDHQALQKLLGLGANVHVQSEYYDGGRQGRSYCFSLDDPQDRRKSTPLHALANNCRTRSKDSTSDKDSIASLKSLLDSGNNVDATDASGRTALHFAVRNDSYGTALDVNFVEELLKSGANPSITNDDGSQPLHLGTRNGRIVRSLIGYGASVNVQNSKSGRTPLFYSIEQYCDDGFLALIECGADCNVEDKDGITPLHVALSGHSYSKSRIETLLDRGANPNHKKHNGEAPLHVMRKDHHIEEIIPLLVSAGADLELRSPAGKTFLMTILSGLQPSNISDIVPALLGTGAKLESRDYAGRTILHQRCKNVQSAARIRSLINVGADPQAVDFAGNTLFHYVAGLREHYHRKELKAMLHLMLEVGLDVGRRNNLGQTPFHIAAGYVLS